MAPAILRSRLDTETVPEAARFAMFQRALGETHDIHRRAGDTRPFRAQLDAALLGDMVVTSGWQMASRIVRTAERAAADGLDHLTFMLVREGAVSGDAGTPIAFGPGRIAILDLTRPIDLHTSDNRNIGVRLSRGMLNGALRSDPDLHGGILEGAAARMISDHFRLLADYAATMPDEDVALVGRATAAIVATCLTDVRRPQPVPQPVPSPSPAAAPDRGAVRARVMHHVEANLTSPALGPEMLQRELHLSRSNLYRALQPDGGIAAYIRARRLEAVHALLCDPGERRGISELAFSFGFASAAHFSTVFRRRFGRPPQEIRLAPGHRRASRHLAGSRGVRDAYRLWLKGLRASAQP